LAALLDLREAQTAKAAVIDLIGNPGRDPTLARFEAARAVKGSTVVNLKPNQIEVVAKALRASVSPGAASALRILERDVVRAAQGRRAGAQRETSAGGVAS
jgi:hypothetical protein